MTLSADPAITSAIHDVAELLEKEGNVRAVFGPPTRLETRTIIPVASVAMGGGAGGIRSLGAAVSTLRRRLFGARGKTHGSGVEVAPGRTLAGGGGGGIDIRPVGFLCEENGQVIFHPIDARKAGR